MAEHEAVFQLFFRKAPFAGGFTVAAGLGEAIDLLTRWCSGTVFTADSLKPSSPRSWSATQMDQPSGCRAGAPPATNGRAIPRQAERPPYNLEARLTQLRTALSPSLGTRKTHLPGVFFLDALFSDIDLLVIDGGVHASAFGFQRCLCKHFSFAIYYLLMGKEVGVHAVLDCR